MTLFFIAKITREQYFNDAINLLNGYEPAIKSLGGRIKAKDFNENDKFNQVSDTKVQVSHFYFLSFTT